MLADCKDTHNVDKESALSEREEFLIKLDYAAAKEEEMESKIQGLKAEQALVVEERVVWGKEKAGLLTRIVLLSEQRSDLMLKSEEAERRSEFQETTIAGTMHYDELRCNAISTSYVMIWYDMVCYSILS